MARNLCAMNTTQMGSILQLLFRVTIKPGLQPTDSAALFLHLPVPGSLAVTIALLESRLPIAYHHKASARMPGWRQSELNP